jgi:alkaline phosphatase D
MFDRRNFLSSLGLMMGGTLMTKSADARARRHLLPLKEIVRKPLNTGPLKSLCFSSCNKETRPQNFWPVIRGFKPDLFIFMGDNVYADTTSPEVMERRYMELKNNSFYREFCENVPMIGIWDDHDYGWNNAGAEYPIKEEAQQIFCDFFDEPDDSPRRTRSGVYTSYTLDNGRIKVILLDLRFNRERPYRWRCKANGPDMLGEEQWEWFEEELRNSTSEVHLIGSSIGAIGDSLNVTEDWDKFPCSQERLIELLERYDPSGLIILSGDKHFAGIFPRAPGPKGKPMLEVMASGTTHAAPRITHPIILARYKRREIFLGRNFSRLQFFLDAPNPFIRVEIRSMDGQLQRHLNWPVYPNSSDVPVQGFISHQHDLKYL